MEDWNHSYEENHKDNTDFEEHPFSWPICTESYAGVKQAELEANNLLSANEEVKHVLSFTSLVLRACA